MLRNLAVAPGSINIPASPVSGMLAWYAADQITSPPSSGSALATWNDLSGNGYNASQGTSGDQPTYNTNSLNGLPTVGFNGSSTYMQATGVPSTAQPLTIFVVAQTSVTGLYCYFGDGSGNVRLGDGTTTEAYAGGSGGITGLTSSSYRIITVLLDGASSVIRENGTQTGSGNPGTHGLTSGVLNIGSNTASNYWDGPIAEMLVYASALTTAQMQQNESYLAGKWGLGAGGGSQQTAASGVVAQAGAVGRSSLI